MRLLLVEDDRMIGSSLRAVLQAEGHAVDWVRELASASSACAAEHFDLILLDLILPERVGSPASANGLSLLRELRARRDTTPVIILTARDAPQARVEGLDSGADDYLALLGLPMAWARIYLGVHFPLDMVGAALVAVLSAWLCFREERWFVEPHSC